MRARKMVEYSNHPLATPDEMFSYPTFPASRVLYVDGTATRWNTYTRPEAWAIEIAAPDQYGRINFARLKIG